MRAMLKWLALCGLLAASAPSLALAQPPILPDTGGIVVPATWVHDVGIKGDTLYFTTESTSAVGAIYKVPNESTATRLARFSTPCLSFGYVQETLFVGLKSSGKVLRSDNGGTVWDTTGQLGGVASVYVLLRLASGAFLAGTGDNNGDVFRAVWNSSVGGAVLAGPTWANGLTIHANALYVATNFDTAELWRSADTGRTWARVNRNFPGTVAYDVFWDQETMYVGLNNSRGVWRSTNAGVSWDSTAKPGGISDIYCFLKPQGRDFLVGTGNTNGDIFRACYSTYVGGGEMSGPRWTNDMTAHGGTLFACTDFDTAELWRSTNSGQTWARVNRNFPGTQIRSMHWDGDTVYVGMNNSQGVQRSNDGGTTWLSTVKPPDAADVYAFCQPDTGQFLIGTGNNNGDVFRAVFMSEVGGAELAGANWVHSAASRGEQLWATAGTSTGRIWRWLPGPDTWVQMAAPPANNILAIEPVGQNLYTGTDDSGKVYVSYDTGATWLRTWPPPGANKTYSFLLSRWAQPAKLLAATGDANGDVFKSDRSIAPDVSVREILAPKGIVRHDTVITPSAIVKNMGFGTARFPTVMNIGPYYSETLQVTLPQNTLDTLYFPTWRASPAGTYAVKCSTMYIEDYAPGNDCQDTTVAVDSAGLPLITSVTPSYGGDTGHVTVRVLGARFVSPTRVFLAQDGRRVAAAESSVTYVVDSGQIIATLAIESLALGRYDIMVMSAQGDSYVYHRGFTVVRASEGIWFDLIGRREVIRGREASCLIRCANTGNIDIDNLIVDLSMPLEIVVKRVETPGGVILWDRDSVVSQMQRGMRQYPDYWLDAPEGCIDTVLKYGDMFWIPTIAPGHAADLKLTLYAPVLADSGTDAVLVLGFIWKIVLARFAGHFCSQVLGELAYPPEERSLGRVFWKAAKKTGEDLLAPLRLVQDVGIDILDLTVTRPSELVDLLVEEGTLGRPGAQALVDKLARGCRRLRLTPDMMRQVNMFWFWGNVAWDGWKKLNKSGDEGNSPRHELDPDFPVRRSIDPNAKIGPWGTGTASRFAPPSQRFTYTIYFENVDSATAPAETVVVTDRLDNNLDWSTLTLDTVSHPAVCRTVLDSVNRTITWRFDNIMLPPNRNPPEGEGFCRFSIMPRQDLPSGIQIRNYATIVFDRNPPMNTDTVLNTIDAFPPTSNVRPLPDTTQTGEFTVRWTGADDLRGSGIRSYDIFVKRDTGQYEPWLTGTTDTMATFIGANESWYRFYSVATDNVGWREGVPSRPDDSTFVNGMAAPVMLYPPDTLFTSDTTPTFFWTATAGTQGTYTLQYSRDSQFLVGVESVPGLADTTYTVPDLSALSDTTWFWRVKAIGRRGTPSTYRATWRFTVDTRAPETPVLLAPPDSSTVDDTTPTFVWSKVSETGSRYSMVCALDTGFTRVVAGRFTSETTYTVPDVYALEDTSYFWRVRAVDRAGNASAYQPRPFTFTVSPLRSISGGVTYYRGAQSGIDSARMVMRGDVRDTVYTAAGHYEFVGVANRSNDSVIPEKVNRTRSGAVGAYDASLILQHVVHMDTLDSLQCIAADVSGNSTISPLDASYILQYAVAMRSHFPVGYRSGLDTLDWAFRPPIRLYTPCTTNYVNENYKGILYGDPSGNWTDGPLLATAGDWGQGEGRYFTVNFPDGPDDVRSEKLETRRQSSGGGGVTATSLAQVPDALRLTPDAGMTVGNRGQETAFTIGVGCEPSAGLVFPVVAKGAKDVVSADMLLRYEAGRYTLDAVRTTRATEGFMVAAADRGGMVRISMAGTRKLNGDVALLELVFGDANGAAAQAPSVKLQAPEIRDRPTTGASQTRTGTVPVISAAGPPSAASPTGNRGQETASTSEAVGRELSDVSPVAEVVWLVLNENQGQRVPPVADGAMGDVSSLPKAFYLDQPKPNPLGEGTRISFGLPKVADVRLAVFDAAGRKVRVLAEGTRAAGRYAMTWNGKDDAGRRLANGIYFVRLVVDKQRFEHKVTMVRD